MPARLEGLEVRDLPSALVVQTVRVGTASGPSLNLIVRARSPVPASRSNAARRHEPGDPTPPWVNQASSSAGRRALRPVTTTTPITVGSQTFPPGTYSVPQPTPREIRRETFWMEFVGHYSVGAPRFSNQSATIHIYSNGRS